MHSQAHAISALSKLAYNKLTHAVAITKQMCVGRAIRMCIKGRENRTKLSKFQEKHELQNI